jgi:hypothetical protein
VSVTLFFVNRGQQDFRGPLGDTVHGDGNGGEGRAHVCNQTRIAYRDNGEGLRDLLVRPLQPLQASDRDHLAESE